MKRIALFAVTTLSGAAAAWAGPPGRFTPDPKLPPELGVPYVVITREALAPEFAPLVDWKRKTGLAAQIVTLEWLEKNPHYPGSDLAERMYLLLKDLALNWKTRWVLLGGDIDVVPDQRVWAKHSGGGCYASSDIFFSDVLPADLADPDKVEAYNWNGNGDRFLGEAGKDGFDLVADLYVGRIPVENAGEAKGFFEKYFEYVKAEGKDLTYLNRAVVSGATQFKNTQTQLKELFEKLGGAGYSATLMIDVEPPDRIAQEISKGCGIFSFYGHGCPAHFWTTDKKPGGTPSFGSAQVNGLRNQGKYPIVYGNSCNTNEYDKDDCFGEAWLLKPRGGAVAYMGYSATCYGSPVKFNLYQNLFGGECPELGRALAEAKQQGGGSWAGQMLNLLGDPEMWVWTSAPRKLQVSEPRLAANMPARVTVLDADGKPKRYARVLLEAGSQTLAAYTDEAGVARLGVPAKPCSARLSIVAQNGFPYEATVRIEPAPNLANPEACVIPRPALAVDDSADGGTVSGYAGTGDAPLATDEMPLPAAPAARLHGNNRKDLNPGETVRLTFSWPPAAGTQPPEGEWKLDLGGDPYVKCLTQAPRIEWPAVSFVLQVDPKVLPWHQVWMTLQFRQTPEGEPWSWTYRVPVEGPSLACVSCAVDDSEGNKDRRIGWEDAGRKVRFGLGLFNRGTAAAQGVRVTLASSDPSVKILKPQLQAGTVPCQDLTETKDRRFEIELAADYDGHPLEFDLAIEDERKNRWPVKMIFTVPPAPPVLVKAEGGSRAVTLSWVHPGSAGICGYHVYRGSSAKGSFTRLTEQPVRSATRHLDRTARPKSAYYYAVSSITAEGLEGRMSEPVHAQTLAPLPKRAGEPEKK